jgi:hypothetical protein
MHIQVQEPMWHLVAQYLGKNGLKLAFMVHFPFLSEIRDMNLGTLEHQWP